MEDLAKALEAAHQASLLAPHPFGLTITRTEAMSRVEWVVSVSGTRIFECFLDSRLFASPYVVHTRVLVTASDTYDLLNDVKNELLERLDKSVTQIEIDRASSYGDLQTSVVAAIASQRVAWNKNGLAKP